jgi:putative Ca2+/H+ antiporter (TMEM165/GDT1 family)
MLYLLLVTYGTIFFSELLGDKSIYTIGSLTMRFRALSVFCGFAAAFTIKMLVAVLLGQIIAQLPHTFVAITSSATLFITAMFIWFKKAGVRSTPREYEIGLSKGALISFSAIVFSEWGDIGQIMAATLAARYKAPLIVWLGGTLALITKGLLALVLGQGLRKRVPLYLLRPISAVSCLVLAVVSAIGKI